MILRGALGCARRRAGAGSDLEAGELWRPKAVQSFGRPCHRPCNMTCKVDVLNKGICGSMWGICMEYVWNMNGVCRAYVGNMYIIYMELVCNTYRLCMECAGNHFGIM